jgi:hypothetical protein
LARIDYYAIEQAIQTQLAAALTTARVLVEEPFQHAIADTTRIVSVFLEGRVPHNDQVLAAGTHERMLVKLSIWCAVFHMESLQVALEQRDDLIGEAELALMADRTLGGVVDSSWLEGGELFASQGQNFPFVAGGEIILIADISAVS